MLGEPARAAVRALRSPGVGNTQGMGTTESQRDPGGGVGQGAGWAGI